jgi:VWFA-related protein
VTRLILRNLIAATLCAPTLAAGQSPATEPATIPANANLVVVDVVVTDAQHNPVHNLATSDFTLLENGHAQAIKTFEEHHSWEAAAPLPTPPTVPPGTFTNLTIAPAGGAMNILLLDSLNTPINAQAVVRQQMMNYLKAARPGMRMAIFGLTSKLVLLQGFTSDPDLLSTLLKAKEDVPKDSAAPTEAANSDTPAADDTAMDATEDAASALGNAPTASQLAAEMQQFEDDTQSFPLQLRARLTLDAFNLLGRYLSRLPGRKNLIWFSGSFPINILPDGDLENPFGAVASSEDEFRETTGLMSRSRVVVYPIDAHGAVAAPAQNPASSDPKPSPDAKYVRTPSSSGKEARAPYQPNSEGNSSMQAMALATGGEVYAATNGLKEAVERAVVAGSNYYTLTYAPIDQQWKGEFRKIQVTTARPGLNLAYRRGYFADSPSVPPHHDAAAGADNGSTSFSAMRSAMLLGSPQPTEIILAATIRPATADTEPDVAPGNEIIEATNGPYRRYTVQFGIDARDIECTPAAEGAHHCALDAVIFVYDADGTLLNSAASGIDANLPADQFASMQQTNIHFRQDISVPVSGKSFLRIGVIDETTNKIGTVELPVSALSKLPPLAAPAATPAAAPPPTPVPAPAPPPQ